MRLACPQRYYTTGAGQERSLPDKGVRRTNISNGLTFQAEATTIKNIWSLLQRITVEFLVNLHGAGSDLRLGELVQDTLTAHLR